jgi:hypothetical protein
MTRGASGVNSHAPTALFAGASSDAEDFAMSTSTKTPNSIRQGGPGASHENAKKPLHVEKPPAAGKQAKSKVSGGGGEEDSHHSHDEARKGGRSN